MSSDAGVPEVSGAAFLGLIRHVKDANGGGAPALDAIVRGAGPDTQAVFARQIRVMSWYPYSAYTSFLVGIDRTLGRGDLSYCRTLGEFAGKRDLGSVFRIYKALASAERLIRSCSKVWTTYHRNAGTMEAVSWQPEETVLRISGFPGMHRGHCRLMEGWMINTMENIGCRVLPGAREIACASKGAPHHEFACRWERA